MKNGNKTREQLINEFAEMRQRVTELEVLESERKRAEGALRENEGCLRDLFETMAEGVVLIAPDGRIVKANRAAECILGIRRSEIEGRDYVGPEWEIERPDGTPMPPEEMAGPRAMKERRPVRNVVMGVRRPDALIRWINVSATPLLAEAGGLKGVVGTFADITERRRAEEVSRTLARLGTGLAAATTVGAMIAVVRDETELLLGWDAHYFAVRRPEDDTFRVVSLVDTVDGQKNTLPEEDWPAANLSPAVRQVLEGLPLLINRAPGNPEPVLSKFGDRDRRSASIMDVPVRGGDKVIGILSVQSYTPRRYDEADLETLQRIADAIAPALARAHAEETLRESEERYRSLVENVPDIIYTLDKDGNLASVNDYGLELLGYRQDELVGKHFGEVIHQDDVQMTLESFKEAVSTKRNKPRGLMFRLLAKDGNIIWVSLNSSVTFDEEGRFLQEQGVARDITERKRAKVKLDKMFKQIKKSHGDLLSILNMLRLGIVMVDEGGCVTFLNQTAERLMGHSQKAVLGRRWQKILSFKAPDEGRLDAVFGRPPRARTKFQAHVEFQGGRDYWMDIVVQADPRNPQAKIFFLYDMSEVYDLRRMLEEKAQFHDLVGKSNVMQSIYRRVQEVARVDWTVLIEGETGTGKELVARAIHFASHRKEKPFIAVNCAGLTDSLLTSQLFGHKRGSFTGAVENHKGLFEAASGGTLLLDEIGDVSMNMQRSLLRVLEEKEMTPLGESQPRKIDVRILASTHRDLSQEAENGNFRPDLLYRIRVARIKLPPLRERREDIPLLVRAFLGQSRAVTGRPVDDVSNEAMKILLEYDWPGNVRELKSAIDVATLHCERTAIHPEDLPPELAPSGHPPSHTCDASEDERQRVLTALESAKGSRTVAARLLGIGRSTLYRRLASLGIKPAK